ncbi:MAG: hypothetical protein E6J79_17560 [Deltaproteobacteria bacterium]|nr:MAG: hypothetical protein E6J79_17560 [Deltaproteobacteria bacterium]
MLVVIAGAAPSVRAAELPGSARAAAALERCAEADRAHGAMRAELLKKGLALAEEAVAADDTDARAHFAVFCNLGKQAKDAGSSVFNLGKLPRLRREVDRTLELVPDSTDALFGKGAMLRATPRLMGGDPAEAERLLRRALEVDPAFFSARLELARALADRHAAEEASIEATRALETARQRGDAGDTKEAEAFLAELAR